MRILHLVEQYWPSIGGAQEVVRRISEGLVARGHEVTVATGSVRGRPATELHGVRIERFAVSGNAARGFRGEVERYREYLLHGRFDLMMSYAAQQWAADLTFPLLAKLPYRKVHAPCGFSGLFDPAYASYFTELPQYYRQHDRLILHSARYRDAAFVNRHGLDHWVVIPNGADAGEFGAPALDFRARHGIPRDQPFFLTVGNHTGQKGHALVLRAFGRARIEPATLAIIGGTTWNNPCGALCRWRAIDLRLRSGGKKRVLLLDPPRTEVVAAYRAANLFLFGSRLECSPLVLFEALAAGVPFISQDVGNAAEIAEWSGGGVILPGTDGSGGTTDGDPTSWARCIEELWFDADRRQALAQAGQTAWRARFTWDRIVDEYELLYRRVLAGAPDPCKEIH